MKQCADRADEAFKELESRHAETMKFLLASDACAQGQGDIDEYNRLRSSLADRLKAIPALLSIGFGGTGLNISRGGSPLESPEFHDEFVKLLDPEQTAALDAHLKQAATKRQEFIQTQKNNPMSLEKIQEILKAKLRSNTYSITIISKCYRIPLLNTISFIIFFFIL